MRRVIYEWTAILAAMVAVSCFGAWVFSCFSDAADVDADLILGEPGALSVPRVSLVRGSVEFFNDAGNRDAVLNPSAHFRDGLPPVVTQRSLFGRPYYARIQEATSAAHGVKVVIPGMTFAYGDVIDFDNTPLFVWQVRVSLLWPFALSSVLAVLAAWRYRIARRKGEAPTPSAGA